MLKQGEINLSDDTKGSPAPDKYTPTVKEIDIAISEIKPKEKDTRTDFEKHTTSVDDKDVEIETEEIEEMEFEW